MANSEQLQILKRGVRMWNKWREENIDTKVDLRKADLRHAKLSGANLNGANLAEADLSGAILDETELMGANLSRAILYTADLYRTDLRKANLTQANLVGANLTRTRVDKARISGSSIYSINVWDLDGKFKEQRDLIITDRGKPIIRVDNIKIAHFLYLILNNEEIRDAIDTITSKCVLILGRFTPERKVILDSLREEIRKRNYIPVLFDFEAPNSRDLTETVTTLANMSRFIIADLTDAKSIPQELTAIVPTLPSVAVKPLILKTQSEYGMFEHFKRYPWVLPIFKYKDEKHLLTNLLEKIIIPCEKKVERIKKEK